jgi:hypothetical protein
MLAVGMQDRLVFTTQLSPGFQSHFWAVRHESLRHWPAVEVEDEGLFVGTE